MAGVVAADLYDRGEVQYIEPIGCPADREVSECGTTGTRVNCWRSTDIYGQRACPYMLYATSPRDHTHRRDTVYVAVLDLREEMKTHTPLYVGCLLARSNDLPAGC